MILRLESVLKEYIDTEIKMLTGKIHVDPCINKLKNIQKQFSGEKEGMRDIPTPVGITHEVKSADNQSENSKPESKFKIWDEADTDFENDSEHKAGLPELEALYSEPEIVGVVEMDLDNMHNVDTAYHWYDLYDENVYIDGKLTTKKNLWKEHEKELIAEFLKDLKSKNFYKANQKLIEKWEERVNDWKGMGLS